MIPDDPLAFAHAWQDAWNRRDVEAVLAHFHPDAVFTSPVAERLGIPGGIVQGKDALRRYWVQALGQNLGLRFEMTQVFAGVDVLVIGYTNQHGVARAEVLVFRDGLVVEGRGAFAAG